jgi:putative hydrolase of the HAD superfamily
VVRDTFQRAGAEVRDFDTCFAQLYAEFARPGAWSVLPGAHEALAELRSQGLSRAVVSNFDHRLPHLLEGLGLAPLLDAIVLPSEARVVKPDPAIFALACTRLGCAPDEVVVVGDDPARDIVAAHAAGLRAIDVRELATLADLPARLSDAPGAAPVTHPDDPA